MDLDSVCLLQSVIRGYNTRSCYSYNSVHRRYCVVSELCTTEISFMASMKKLNTLFYEPLMNAAKLNETTLIPRLMIQGIFPRIEDIFVNSCVLSNTFDNQKLKWKYDSLLYASLQKCLLLLMPLGEYTLQFDNIKKTLQTAYKIPAFKDFITKQCMSKELNGLSLNDLTIMFVTRAHWLISRYSLSRPVQRLMRYPMLIKELIKSTPASHEDAVYLPQVLEQYTSFVSNLNNQSKMNDYLLDVTSCLCCIDDCLQPWRYCLYYGVVFFNSTQTPSFAFVFNDRFCYTQTVYELTHYESLEEEDAAVVRYFEYQHYQQVKYSSVTLFGPSAEQPRTYEIHTGSMVDYIMFPDDADMEQWVNVLTDSISQFKYIHRHDRRT